MAEFKIIFYIILAMSVLLIAVFLWGALTYKKTKSTTKFLNKPLLTLALSLAGIAFILAWVPIFMQVWKEPDSFVKQDPAFISILVLEILFLVAFLAVSYIFAFDFGIALNSEEETLQFFGQTINTSKIIELEEKKVALKIVYEQGFKNIKKKVTLLTPNAKKFAKEILSSIVAENQAKRTALETEEKKVVEMTQNVEQ